MIFVYSIALVIFFSTNLVAAAPDGKPRGFLESNCSKQPTVKRLKNIPGPACEDRRSLEEIHQALIRGEIKKRLILSHKDLKEIPDWIFNYSALQSIDLHHNQIKKIPVKFFTSMLNLKYLDLLGNRLDGIEGELLEETPFSWDDTRMPVVRISEDMVTLENLKGIFKVIKKAGWKLVIAQKQSYYPDELDWLFSELEARSKNGYSTVKIIPFHPSRVPQYPTRAPGNAPNSGLPGLTVPYYPQKSSGQVSKSEGPLELTVSKSSRTTTTRGLASTDPVKLPHSETLWTRCKRAATSCLPGTNQGAIPRRPGTNDNVPIRKIKSAPDGKVKQD